MSYISVDTSHWGKRGEKKSTGREEKHEHKHTKVEEQEEKKKEFALLNFRTNNWPTKQVELLLLLTFLIFVNSSDGAVDRHFNPSWL